MTSSIMRRRLPLLLSFASLIAVAACEFGETTVAPGRARPVVHAVLNPVVGLEFRVLLERSLTGRVDSRETTFDPDDPIVSGGGEPLSNARVEICFEDRVDCGIGTELSDTLKNGKGKGVYVFLNVGCSLFCPTNGIVLTRGRTYTLTIQLPTGEIVNGVTQIPVSQPRPDTGFSRTFDATSDTYIFSWPAAQTLRRYAVQIQTPYGPFQTFSNAESLAINGSLRNFQQDRFPKVFVPGFRQAMQSLAVDQNYYNFFRSENSEFTGLGLVSSVAGGSGVFGAISPIRTQFLDVTAPFDDPVDGVWVLVGGTTAFPARITTYTDGPYASGRLEDVFAPGPDFQTRRGLLGRRRGDSLYLDVLNFQRARDVAWTIAGQVRGDTLYTTSEEYGEQKWRRQSVPSP